MGSCRRHRVYHERRLFEVTSDVMFYALFEVTSLVMFYDVFEVTSLVVCYDVLRANDNYDRLTGFDL